MLLDNEYPEEVLDKALSEVRYGLQNPRVKPETEDQKGTTYLCLPYISEAHCRQIYYILRKNNLFKNTRVTFKPGDKLKDILTSTKLKPTNIMLMSGNAICVKVLIA